MTTLARFLESFPPARRGEPLVRSLAEHLSELIDAADLPQRLRAFVALVEWARGGGARAPGEADRRRAGGSQPAACWPD